MIIKKIQNNMKYILNLSKTDNKVMISPAIKYHLKVIKFDHGNMKFKGISDYTIVQL